MAPMRHLGPSSVLVCSLALAVALPTRAHALVDATAVEDAKQAEPSRTGRVFVDATALGEAGPYLAGEATKRAGECLVQEGVMPTEAPAGPELRVTIVPGETTGYSITYEIVYDGEVVEEGSGASDCQLCTEGELLDRVDAIAREQAPKMVEPVEEPEITDPGDGKPEVEITPPGGDGGGDDEPEGMGGMGKAGVALLVGGGVATVSGVVLVALPPKPLDENDPLQATKLRTLRPPGGAVLGAGLATAVVGIVLLAIDGKRRRERAKASETASSPTAAIRPWFGGGGAGIGVSGRF